MLDLRLGRQTFDFSIQAALSFIACGRIEQAIASSTIGRTAKCYRGRRLLRCFEVSGVVKVAVRRALSA
jgi:hypothetical protein